MKKLLLLFLAAASISFAGTFTQKQVDDMIARQLTPFKQDVVGNNSIAISQNTETVFAVNGLARNESHAPAYFTNRFDTTTYVMNASTEYDSPTYVGNLSFIWTPTASSEGIAIVRLYINDTVPKIIGTYDIDYKGALAIPRNVITTWYWGSEAGYDAKNDGVYWTIQFEHDGTISSPALSIYNTQ